MTLSELIAKYSAIADDDSNPDATREAAAKVVGLLEFLQHAHEIVTDKLHVMESHASQTYWNFDNYVSDAACEMKVYEEASNDFGALYDQIR